MQGRPVVCYSVAVTLICLCTTLHSQSFAAAQVYVTSGNGISVADVAQSKVVAGIPVSSQSFLALSPDGKRLYASDFNGLNVIDALTNTVITTIPAGFHLFEPVVSPDGKRVYVANLDSSSVAVIDTSTNSVIAQIPISGNPVRLAIKPDGSHLYVGTARNGVHVIDALTNSVVGQVTGNGTGLENAPTTGIAVTADGNRAYVGSGAGVFIIDARQNSVLSIFLIPGIIGGIGGIAVSSDGSKVYLGNDRSAPDQGTRAVFVFDPIKNAVMATIPVGEPSAQLTLSADGTQLYVGDTDTGNLDVVDTQTNSIIEAVHVSDLLAITGVATRPRLIPQLPSAWPMSGHDPQKTGLSVFLGPTRVPAAPSWTYSTGAPVIGDLVVSAEGIIYFTSDKLYALNPDGTPYVPAVPISPLTSPVVDDVHGVIYVIANNSASGYDVLRYSKQLQNPVVVFHGSFVFVVPTSMTLGPDGTVYFSDGVSIVATGPRSWRSADRPCFGNPGFLASTLGTDGSVYSMCQPGGGSAFGSGIYRFNGNTGEQTAFAGYSRGGTELIIDAQNHVRAGYQAFNGIIFTGSYDSWDSELNQLTTTSLFDFTTSRSALMPDGFSTVRIGFSFQSNELEATGAHVWGVPSGPQTLPNFSTVPTVDASGNVFVGTVSGVAALSGIDGRTIWFSSLGDTITTQPAISSDGSLIVGSSGGKVYAFRSQPTTGTIVVSTNNAAATFTITGPVNFTGTGTSFVYSNAPVGQYKIAYGNVDQYIAPPAETKTLVAGESLAFDGSYIPITLSACAANVVGCSHSLTFVVPAGFIGPISPQSILISSNAPSLAFLATASTNESSHWLSIAPTAGAAPASLDVIVSGNLPPGTHNGQITVTAPSAVNSPQVVLVSLVITSAPKKTPPRLVVVLFIGAALSGAPADPNVGDGLKQLLNEITTNPAFPGAAGKSFSHRQFNDAVGFVSSNLGEQDALIIVGHSAGGNTGRLFAQYISQASFASNHKQVRVRELIVIDPIDPILGTANQAFNPQPRPNGVDFVLGFYQRYGTPGLIPPDVAPCSIFDIFSLCGYRIVPADLEYRYDVPHTELDNDARVHQNIMQTLINIIH